MIWYVIEVTDLSKRPMKRTYYTASKDDAQYLIELLKRGYVCMDHVPGNVLKCRRLGISSKWRYISLKEAPKPTSLQPVNDDLIKLKKRGVIQ